MQFIAGEAFDLVARLGESPEAIGCMVQRRVAERLERHTGDAALDPLAAIDDLEQYTAAIPLGDPFGWVAIQGEQGASPCKRGCEGIMICCSGTCGYSAVNIQGAALFLSDRRGNGTIRRASSSQSAYVGASSASPNVSTVTVESSGRRSWHSCKR